MSRKNHKIVGNRLIQTDKKFSALKQSQKEKITEWLYLEYRTLYIKNNLPPDSRYNKIILDNVQEKISGAEIWLPFYELRKYFYSRKNKFQKRYEKEILKADNNI